MPVRANVGSWFQAYESWLNQAGSALSALRSAALEELLSVEASLANHAQNRTTPPPAPTPSTVPENYPTLLPGEERPIQTKLNWWDSFQTAAGPVASTLRFSIAFAIVAAAIWFTLPEPWIDWLMAEGWRDVDWANLLQSIDVSGWIDGFRR